MFRRLFPLWLLFTLLFALALSVSAQESLPELVRRVKPSVVSVITYNTKNEPLISGSGFFIRPGQVITNLRVIEGAARAEIRTLDGKGKTYPVTGTLNVDEEGDIALLGVDVPQDRPRAVEVAEELPE